MWIEKKDKKEYNDFRQQGLRLKFYPGLTEDDHREYCLFCNWLRKQYFFPVRVYLCFVAQKAFYDMNDGHKYYGVFYSDLECKERGAIYPRIFVAAKSESKDERASCIFTIIHELTHYFQWYFYEDEKRSDRSLEIEANRWARYLLWKYESL